MWKFHFFFFHFVGTKSNRFFKLNERKKKKKKKKMLVPNSSFSAFEEEIQKIGRDFPILCNQKEEKEKLWLSVIKRHVDYHLRTNFIHFKQLGTKNNKQFFFDHLITLKKFINITQCFRFFIEQIPNFQTHLKEILMDPTCRLLRHAFFDSKIKSQERIQWLELLVDVEPKALHVSYTDYGRSLDIAINHSDHETIQFLIEKKADPIVNRQNNLNECAFLGDVKFMKFFLDHGATINSTTFQLCLNGWLSQPERSRGYQWETFKFTKQHLSTFEYRQYSLDIRRKFETNEAYRVFASRLFPQSAHVLRQVDLLPKHNMLVQWLSQLEFLLGESCGFQFPFELILLIRDYNFPNYLLLGFERYGNNPSSHICPQYYLFPSLQWFRLQKLNKDPPLLWTVSPHAGCLYKTDTEDENIFWLSSPFNISVEGIKSRLNWDCYSCPCRTHRFHAHTITLLENMNIIGFYPFKPKQKKEMYSKRETLLEKLPRQPEMILRYLTKYEAALNWESVNKPKRDHRNFQLTQKEKKKMTYLKNLNNYELIKENKKKLFKIQKLKESIKSEVSIWYPNDIFFNSRVF